MAQVALTINGRSYQIVCDQGQEEHLRELAKLVNERVSALNAMAGQVGEMTILVLALLWLADELRQAQTGTDRIEQNHDREQSQAELMEALTAGKLEDFANRIEQVAARLKEN